jgi:outer membrane protein insertion porin family
MRHSAFVLAAVLAALPLAAPLSAQHFQPKSIQFRGDPDYTDQELLDATGLRRGVVLSGADMSAAAQKLMASGVFQNAAYKFDGQDLIFTLAADPTLYPVRLGNLPFTPGPDLDARLHKSLPLYHGKVPAEGGLLDDICQAFETMLAAEGVKATVAGVPYAGPKDHNKASAMSFTITSPAVRLGAIHIDGASMALLTQVQNVIHFAADMPFSSVDTPSALADRITSFYRLQGFAAVKVDAAPSGALITTPDAIRVPVKITVREGRAYKVASIHLPPDALVTQAEADKIQAAPAQSAPGEALPNVLSLVDGRYKAKGYLDLVVTPQPTFNDAAGTVDYTIEIDPGAVYHVAYVKFDNVSDELRSLLMRQWQLMPGDVFDQTYLDTFLIKAQRQDPVLRSSLAGVLSTMETSADPTTHDVDVTIKLEKP